MFEVNKLIVIMKNTFGILIAVLMFLMPFSLLKGQENVVKLGLGSAINLNLHAKYERVLGDKTSLQLGLIYDVPRALPGIFTYTDVPSNTDYRLKRSGFYAIPEFRYYLGKKDAPAGFYLGAYTKFGRTKLAINDVPVTNMEIPTDIFIKLNHFAIGPQMGVQWVINDAFVIDWNILGIGFSFWSGKWGFESDDDLLYSRDELLNEFEMIIDGLEDIDESQKQQMRDLGDNIIERIDGNSYQSPSVGTGFLDLRLGVSIGYAF